MRIEALRLRWLLPTVILTLYTFTIREADATATLLPLRWDSRQTCTGTGATAQTIETSYGASIAGLPFTGTTAYDFYSSPISASPALTTADKGNGQVWLWNGNSSADFKVTVRFVFYDYNPATGVDKQIVDTGASSGLTVKHENAAELTTPQASVPAAYTPVIGHLLHVKVFVTLSSGSVTSAYLLLNAPNGTTGDSVALLPAASSKVWTFAPLSAPPSITKQPTNAIVCSGLSTGFSVTASNATSYQWRKGGVNLSDGGNLSGAHGPLLTINPAGSGDVGTYDCLVGGAAPCQSVTSSSASLTVNAGTTILTQPADRVACCGSAASFSVVANGTALSFQWRKNGVNLSNSAGISGVTNSTLSFSCIASNDCASALAGYDCVVSGACSQVISSRAALVMATAPASLALTANPDKTMTIGFTGTPGGTYAVQATSDLAHPAWVNLSTTVAGLTGAITVRDSGATNYPQRFYRAAAQ